MYVKGVVVNSKLNGDTVNILAKPRCKYLLLRLHYFIKKVIISAIKVLSVCPLQTVRRDHEALGRTFYQGNRRIS